MLIKQKNPKHMYFIGNTVHIVNNAAKAQVKPFDQYVEQITDEIYYDIQNHPKCVVVFQEGCGLRGTTGAISLICPIPSRLLQMIDVVERQQFHTGTALARCWFPNQILTGQSIHTKKCLGWEPKKLVDTGTKK